MNDFIKKLDIGIYVNNVGVITIDKFEKLNRENI